jgi:excisionase family DNA binding protein
METYLTIPELAAHIKVSAQTVRRYVLDKEVPYHKIKKGIRFRLSEIERWIESGALDTRVGPIENDTEPDLFSGLEKAGEAGNNGEQA